jgi:hypothetical protein
LITRKKLIILICAVIITLASIYFIIRLTKNGYIIEKQPEIYGCLNFSEGDLQNHVISFSINISYRNAQQAYIEKTETMITIIHNNSFLNDSSYNWEYVDINNDGLINSGDNVVVRLNHDYSGLIEVYLNLPGFRGTLSAEYEGNI